MFMGCSMFTCHAVNAASQSFHTGSYPSRRINSATSPAERSSAILNCPVAFVAFSGVGAHSLAPDASSTIRPRSV